MRTQVALVAFVAVLAARASSSQVPLGGELQVNAYTTAQQSGACVAAQPRGAFVPAWDSVHQDGSVWGVFARRYDASGAPITAEEAQVNTYTTNSRRFSAAAVDQAGNMVVVWVGYGADAFSNGVYARHYDATGTPGSEQRVSAYTTGSNTRPAVAAAAGGFVVVWHGAGDGSGLAVLGRRLDSSGVLQGDEFVVNSHTTDHQWQPAVAGNSDGNFVVVWASGLQDGSTSGVFGLRFNASGATQGSEFAVNASTTGVQYQPAVALDGERNFVVVWTTYLQDGSKIRVDGQRFDAYATRQGAELQISTHTMGDQDFPAVASSHGRTTGTKGPSSPSGSSPTCSSGMVFQ